MAEAILNIKRWGNSLGVRLPLSVASEAHLHLDQQVRIKVVDGDVVITQITDISMSLEERLKRFDPSRHGGEVMATEAIGAERW